jgi:hypothetical protein
MVLDEAEKDVLWTRVERSRIAILLIRPTAVVRQSDSPFTVTVPSAVIDAALLYWTTDAGLKFDPRTVMLRSRFPEKLDVGVMKLRAGASVGTTPPASKSWPDTLARSTCTVRWAGTNWAPTRDAVKP